MEVSSESKNVTNYDVQLTQFQADGKPTPGQQSRDVKLRVESVNGGLNLTFSADGAVVAEGRVVPSTTRVASGDFLHILHFEQATMVIRFADTIDASRFATTLKRDIAKTSVFDERTEESSAKQYFQFYGYLCQQQNMMQDFTRTSTYQAAILQNGEDFRGKVVLDVGAGSGILSFFAAHAGARKVYAIEASSVAQHAKTLVENNNMSGIIEVIHGQIEEVHVPEEVDIIISEPMGYMLFNERMLETFLHAKKWLKPNGRMFPSQGDLYCSPFMDDMLSMEMFNKANFWCMSSFHGVDLSSLRATAADEYARQPVVDTFDVRILLARPNRYTVNFSTADETDLHRIHYPVKFEITQPGTIHGLAFWFDVAFIGSTSTIWLSTAPHEPLTHWYQVRCLLKSPLLVRIGQTVTGTVTLLANTRQSYDVTIELSVDGTTQRSSNCLDLKNPYFRYTGMQAQPPAQANQTGPTDAYWGGAADSLTTINPSTGLDTTGKSAGYAGMRGTNDVAVMSSYGPVGSSYTGLSGLTSGTNGSVMSTRIASNISGGAAYAVMPDQLIAQQPAQQQHQQQQAQLPASQVHPALASRFGLHSVQVAQPGSSSSNSSSVRIPVVANQPVAAIPVQGLSTVYRQTSPAAGQPYMAAGYDTTNTQWQQQ